MTDRRLSRRDFLKRSAGAAGAAIAASSAGSLLGSVPWAAAGEPPVYDPSITPPWEVIPDYKFKRASVDDMYAYYRLVATQTDRVVVDTFAHSWQGRDLIYALVSTPEHVADADGIAARQQLLRDPRITTPEEAAELAATNPAIVWYMANVHGREPSGGDAAIQILYELAARTDAEVTGMLDHLLIGLIPTQNPDGRENLSRDNVYGFDMNRDWFARTQPETDGKLDLLNRFPPVLAMDAHENGSRQFFFPPNADPVHHEVSPQSIDWMNNLYAPELELEFAKRKRFQPQQWDVYHYSVYDFFGILYGDAVPAVGFTAAGILFEKGGFARSEQRFLEQWVAGWTDLRTASQNKETVLNQYYAAHVTALAEGAAGQLEPNALYQPGTQLRQEVPDILVRHYFLPPAEARAYPDVAELVGRLLGMGVEVHRLDADLSVPDLRHYGRDPASETVPAGSFWIPMAQPQKRWIQTQLGEDGYPSVAAFYDIASWSNPLLLNLDATFSGSVLSPAATRVTEAPAGEVVGPSNPDAYWFSGDSGAAVAGALSLARDGFDVRRLDAAEAGFPQGAFVVPDATGLEDAAQSTATQHVLRIERVQGTVPAGRPFRQPKVALYSPSAYYDAESAPHLRYLFEQVWTMPYTPLSATDVIGGALARDGYEVFVVPGVTTGKLVDAKDDVEAWIAAGGVFVGATVGDGAGGTPFAVASGWTSSSLSSPAGFHVPGSLFRVARGPEGPLTLGAAPWAYVMNNEEPILSPSTTGVNAFAYPTDAGDFWWSGAARSAGELKGSSAVVEETLGEGRVVLFSSTPNFRAWTIGTQFLLANAIVYPSSAPRGTDVRSSRAAASARQTADLTASPFRSIAFEVSAAQAEQAMAIVEGFTSEGTVSTVGGSAFVRIPNRTGQDREWHPFARDLVEALRRSGVELRLVIV